MKIGAVDFLNAYPLYWALQDQNGVELVRDIPSRLSSLLQHNELDVAIISSIEYHRHCSSFSYLPQLCIAARGRVESIRLFGTRDEVKSNQGFTELLSKSSGPVFFYDRATRSSIAMLRIIVNNVRKNSGARFIEIEPPYDSKIKSLKNGEFVLLIGDSALKRVHLPSLDLGELYFFLFKKSFVYALWVYGDAFKLHSEILMNAFQEGKNNHERMIEDAIARFGFDPGFTRKYLGETIVYEFNNDLKQDMNFFFEEYDKLEPIGGT